MSSKIQKKSIQNLKSRSLKNYGQQLNDSFFDESSFEHSQTVIKALSKLITSCLGQNYLKYFGHFDLKFQTSNLPEEEMESNKLSKMIQKNELLSDIQRNQFLLDLQNQSQLKKFMEQLNFIQNQKTVSQLCYITFTIWERYLEFQSAYVIENPIVPKFNCSKDLQQHMHEEQLIVQIQKISLHDLLNAAENLANELYLSFLSDSKLLNITMRNIDLSIPKLEMHALFREFLRTFIKAVYLSIEGYFQHPDSEQGNFDQFFQNQTGWTQNSLEMDIENQGQLPSIFF